MKVRSIARRKGPPRRCCLGELDRAAGRGGQCPAQLVDARAVDHAGADDRRRLEECARHQLADFLLDQIDPARFGQVAFGQRDYARIEPQETKDLQVFAGLGLDRIVGGDDQHGQVDAGGPGEHVSDEAFVPRHVDDSQPAIVELQARRSLGRS